MKVIYLKFLWICYIITESDIPKFIWIYWMINEIDILLFAISVLITASSFPFNFSINAYIIIKNRRVIFEQNKWYKSTSFFLPLPPSPLYLFPLCSLLPLVSRSLSLLPINFQFVLGFRFAYNFIVLSFQSWRFFFHCFIFCFSINVIASLSFFALFLPASLSIFCLPIEKQRYLMRKLGSYYE